MGGLYTIAASARLPPPFQDHFGLGEIVTCGTWHLQVANEGSTATTVSAPSTHQSSVVGPQILHPERGLLHHDLASQEFAVNGTTHSVHSLAASTSMPA